MRSQRDPITMKKGVNKIENEGEKWNRLLQKCQMTDFCETIDQLYVQLCLEQNVIETNRFFLQKERVNKIKWGIKRDQIGSENVNIVEVPHHLQVWECPPPPGLIRFSIMATWIVFHVDFNTSSPLPLSETLFKKPQWRNLWDDI